MLGVIVGVTREAACLSAVPTACLIRCSGADAGRAERQAAELVQAGVTGLLSFGTAGGLDPALQPGDLVLPERVIAEDGRVFVVDDAWRTRLAAGRACRGGTLLSATTPIAGPAAKRRWAERTPAIAVDTESAGVATVAAARRLPFAVVRAIVAPSPAICRLISRPRWRISKAFPPARFRWCGSRPGRQTRCRKRRGCNLTCSDPSRRFSM